MEHVMFVGQNSLSIDDIIKQNYEMILFKQHCFTIFKFITQIFRCKDRKFDD